VFFPDLQDVGQLPFIVEDRAGGLRVQKHSGMESHGIALVSMNGSLLPAAPQPCGYWFEGLRLQADGILLCGKTRVSLTRDELAALRLLLSRAGKIVSHLELKRALWGDARVASGAVLQCIASLRTRLEPADCIQIVYKRGFRISASVHRDDARQPRDLPRLAVLPFAAGFGVPDYLVMAVAEGVMEQLSDPHNPIASVVARDSVFTLAARGASAREVGRAVCADLVLTGELKATTKHDWIRAEMIRIEDGAQLWIEDFFFSRRRIALLVRELVRRVTYRLHGCELFIAAAAEEEDETAPFHGEAIELFHRAHFEWQSLDRHRMQDGMGSLQRAIELDPTMTTAWVDLARVCMAEGLMGFMAPTAAAEMLRRAIKRLPSGMEIPEGMLPTIGWMDFHVDRDLQRAEREFGRAAHLAHDPWVTRMRTMFALSRHHFGEALDLLQDALAADPFSPWLQARLGWALHLSGDASESVKQIHRALDMFPEHASALLYGAMVLAYNGETARAVELAQRLRSDLPHFDIATAVSAYAFARAGNAQEARALLERLEWLSRERFVMKTFQAAVYVALNDIDAALRELCAANRCRCPWFFQMLADPRLEPLSGAPEFEAMRAMLTTMEAEAAEATA
jgi:DNA-binding winged helix-turn-helix (wHTH) protein